MDANSINNIQELVGVAIE